MPLPAGREPVDIPPDWNVEAAAPPATGPGAVPPRRIAPAGGGLRDFLEGAGIGPPGDLDEAQQRAALRVAGATFRAAVLGTMELLRSRAAIKSAFRVDPTTVRARGNNPLKFGADPEETLSGLLTPRPGFQPADQAMREALEDLGAHELALMSALQDALAALVRQFDPAELATRLDTGSGPLAGLLPSARKARCWELYEQRYRAVVSELQDDLSGTFGRALTEAYTSKAKQSRRR
jgi:type VI secretion system FHA domain protein